MPSNKEAAAPVRDYRPKMKRVSFMIPEPLYEDLKQFADERAETLAGVFRWSLGVGKTIHDAVKEGKSIRLHSADDERVEELLVTKYS